MRFYGFGNYYLSSLQQGLQAGHAACELFVKYDEICLTNMSQPNQIRAVDKNEIVYDWAKYHKTMVLLNGGNSADLADLFAFLDTPENPYPYVKFHEDEVSLNGALTYVGIILPELIYETSALLRQNRNYTFGVNAEAVIITTSPSGADVRESTVIPMSMFEFELCERLTQYGLAK